MRLISKFRPGETVYTCQCCNRKTRNTINGTGDYCGECEELMMLQNSHWDGDYTPNADPVQDKIRDRWIATIAKRGGDVEAVKRQCRAIFPD